MGGTVTKSAAVASEGKAEDLVEQVRERYGKIAEGKAGGCCEPAPSSTSCCGGGSQSVSVRLGYEGKDLSVVPDGADLGLGCGAPVRHLELKAGEAVLDLGSGGGIDVFLAARLVGSSGHVIGVDMTPAMLERARRNAEKGGYRNVEFREGRLERLPVDDASIDAVTSNCVINLVPDKPAVFREIARVLKPGGRMVISDVVLDGRLPEAVEKDVLAYVGCIAGAAPREVYFEQLRAAGLGEVEVLGEVDSLEQWTEAAPEEAKALAARTGVKPEDVLGKVRSVTYRARKPR
jgi:SAM-dependent methyltransferase